MRGSVTRLCQAKDCDVYFVMMIPPRKMLCHKFMYLHATGVYSLVDYFLEFILLFKGVRELSKKSLGTLGFLQLVP